MCVARSAEREVVATSRVIKRNALSIINPQGSPHGQRTILNSDI
jgi:hypothetical protein